MAYDVIALGEILIDFSKNGISSQGNPIFEANPGGAPGNMIAMLCKLGRKAGFIGKVGDDGFGRQLCDALEEVGIPTEGLCFDKDVHTTLAFIHTLPDGDRDFSFYRKPGADIMLSEDDIKEEMFEGCKIFHFGSMSSTGEPSRSATRKAIKVAKEKGAVISFDPNLREPVWDSLDAARAEIDYGISVADILKISDNEIIWYTGSEDFDEGVKIIFEKFPDLNFVLVTMGKDGSNAYVRENDSFRKTFTEAFVQEGTIETTGAGDTFCACIINYVFEHGLKAYSDEELTEMLTFANAAASIVTTRRGALRVMPGKEEVLRLIAEKK